MLMLILIFIRLYNTYTLQNLRTHRKENEEKYQTKFLQTQEASVLTYFFLVFHIFYAVVISRPKQFSNMSLI